MSRFTRRARHRVQDRSRLVRRGIASAVQVAVSAGVAWWIADRLLPWEEPLYAPIAAIVAIGTGQNRLLGTPVRLLGGMLVAVGVASVAVGLLGTGVWQIILITLLTTLTGRFLFDDSLARTYSAFHGAVIAVLGSEQVFPEQFIEAVIGSAVGLVVVHLVFPPRVDEAALDTVLLASVSAHRALHAAAAALESGDRTHSRRAVRAAEQIEATVAPDDGRQQFARQIALLSPLRWRERRRVGSAVMADAHLSALLLDVASFIRLVDHLMAGEPTQRPAMARALDRVGSALEVVLRTPPLPEDTAQRIDEELGRARRELEEIDDRSALERMVCEHLLQLGRTMADVAQRLTDEEPPIATESR